MDAEHRHELKTNELAEWIEHFPQFCKKNGSTIILGILIVVVIIGYSIFKNKSQQGDLEQQAQTTNQIEKINMDKGEVLQGVMSGTPVALMGFEDSAEALLKASKDAKTPHSAAMALIKRGEALRAELHYTAGKVEKGVIATQIALAKEAYTNALEKAEGDRNLTAMASYGLALCEEEIGNFALAHEQLMDIAHNVHFKGTIFPAQAQYRIYVMADHKRQFTFVVAPKPELVIPEGFDRGAAEALDRGDIYMEGAPKPKVTPEPEVTVEPEVTPEPEVYGPKPQPEAEGKAVETEAEPK
jgi:hypothetical protein